MIGLLLWDLAKTVFYILAAVGSIYASVLLIRWALDDIHADREKDR